MNLLLVIFTVCCAFSLWTILSIFKNYISARTTGLPIVISPFTPLNPLYIILCRSFPSFLSFSRRLPFGLGVWARCTYIGWAFDDKHAIHDKREYGPIFILVTPGGNEVVIADGHATHAIFARRKDFIKPAIMYDQLNVFGPNVNTVEGKDWERQRRLTAPSFNERTSAVVWDETIRQTRDMVSGWVREGATGTFETVSDTATLALHVLTQVGFGIEYPFGGGVRELPEGHVMTYRDSLLMCLQNIITFAIIPKTYLSISLAPKKLRRLGVAAREFQRYMEEMISRERDAAETHGSSKPNLMSTLVRVSNGSQDTRDSKSSKNDAVLNKDEVFGNIFAFNLAGHETTANTVASALVLLAANPSYQDWICSEIDGGSSESDEYHAAFPKLKRCLAVMYETLRLYGSIVFVPKETGSHTQAIEFRGKQHVLPAHTGININVQALHTDPDIWGSDALEWKPDRWLHASLGGDPDEEFMEPAMGNFVPWADGPRACLGRKFSQVEFVGVVSFLFRHHRVRPAGSDGEEGRKSLMRMTDDMAITYVTLQMARPKRVALVWERRGV